MKQIAFSVALSCSIGLALTASSHGQSEAVREGRHSGASSYGGNGSRGGPDQNPNCNKAEARVCQATAKQQLSDCNYSLLIDCKQHIMDQYSECKMDAGCK